MKRKGFTLVEIMVGLAILALLAACAIPSLLSARRSANEAAAKSTLRSLSTAAETYSISNGGLYPATVAELTTFISSAADYCTGSLEGPCTPPVPLGPWLGAVAGPVPANAMEGGPLPEVSMSCASVRGYYYSCNLSSDGYTFVAQPVTPGTTGNVTYTATTGSVLTPL